MRNAKLGLCFMFVGLVILLTLSLGCTRGQSRDEGARGKYIATSSGKARLINGVNRPRGEDELIIYTPDHDSSTGCSRWGVEVRVSEGVVREVRDGIRDRSSDAPIPEDGYVASGHGSAGEWLRDNVSEGDNLERVTRTSKRRLVGVLVSGYNLNWYNQMGLDEPHWRYFSELQNIVENVRSSGHEIIPLSDQDLEYAYEKEDDYPSTDLSQIKTLILPNTRRMTEEQCQTVAEFVSRGGTILAMMQSSYKDSWDRRVTSEGYQLHNLLKVRFVNFSQEPPHHAFIRKEEDHQLWGGVEDFLPTERHWAMVNKVLDGGKVLGSWYDSGKVFPSHTDSLNGAVVEGERSLYIGEQLFAPINYENADVQKFLQNAVEYLYGMEEEETYIPVETPSRSPSIPSGKDETQSTLTRVVQEHEEYILAGVGIVFAVIGYTMWK